MAESSHGFAPGLIIAAPSSGQGKTTLTLGLIAAFADEGIAAPAREGIAVRSFKVGPDYIDPAFHEAASGRPCFNLDPWAMRGATLDALAAGLFADAELVIGEGVMGLFDGAADGTGSTADLAVRFGLPVVLVIDAGRQGASIAALVEGFRRHRDDVNVAGVVLNRVASSTHEATLRRALDAVGVPVLGALPRDATLGLPERHLGLVQAREHAALGEFIARAAELVARHVDLAKVRQIAAPPRLGNRVVPKPLSDAVSCSIPPLGQRIAIARDDAFAFLYPHVVEGWRRQGMETTFFSPLADEPPHDDCDAVYLPGGYPELHAGRLAANARFLEGVRAAAMRGATVYGECGGYMVLGDGLIDADGIRHAMAGLLPLETSFAARKLHLGYRTVELLADSPLGPRGARFRGHEFHYATILREGNGTNAATALLSTTDATGKAQPPSGLAMGRVTGSFVHLIDQA